MPFPRSTYFAFGAVKTHRFVQISRKEHYEVYLREPSGYTSVDGRSPHRNFAGRKVVHRGVNAERASFYRLAEHRRGRAQ